MSLLDEDIIDKVNDKFFDNHIEDMLKEFLHSEDIVFNPCHGKYYKEKYDRIKISLINSIPFNDDCILTYSIVGPFRFLWLNFTDPDYVVNYDNIFMTTKNNGYIMKYDGNGIYRRVTLKMIRDWFNKR